MRFLLRLTALASAVLLAAAAPAQPSAPHYFAIHVVDADSSRGIPLVHVRTHNSIWNVTDSGGWVAFHEPGLMDRDIFFDFASDGYETPADGFDIKGRRLHTKPGTTATVALKRIQPAERLYRITGEGIYSDTVMLGMNSPLRQPLSNAQVSGQDGGLMTRYRDRLFWAYGDTGTARYPLAGNFKGTCAWSDLPGRGGLEAHVGVDLQYITTGTFVREMVPLQKDRLYWISSLLPVAGKDGAERLIASCGEVKAPMEGVAHLML